MIASSKRDKHGAHVLKLSYTGTTQQAAQASKEGRAFAAAEKKNQKFESKIRDHTGSGVEHLPEDAPVQKVKRTTSLLTL